MALFITIYMLIWPVVVAGVLFVLVRAFFKDWRASHKAGRTII